MARSAQLPTSIFSSVSSANQSGGIVNGIGLNHNINGHTTKPFLLKLIIKATNLRICQSCCKDYDGSNGTLGLVVSRAEWRLVSNLATGVQFLEKESSSHHHALNVCLLKDDATFSGAKLALLPDVKGKYIMLTKVCTLQPVAECQQKRLIGGVLSTS